MTDRATRWGVLPRYFGYRGDVVETLPATEEAILAAMGASGERPPRARPFKVPQDSCAPPPDRGWGWAVQLYAVRSRASWGIGDLGDLRRLAGWTRREGGSLILLNPLGAQNPTLPYEATPYFASSRRFRNVIYLRVEEVEGAEMCAEPLEPLRIKGQDLNQARLIDYDQVFKLKSQALELIFHALPEPRGLAGWASGKGHALRDFATFNALAEAHGTAWRNWPSSLQHPRNEEVARRRAELSDRVAFHTWLQFHFDRQLARAAREIDLINDMPVGFAPDGFDAWRWQDLLAPGMRIGAPPDEFFPDGQDWGLPPFDPWKLRRANFEPFIEAVRSASVHAAGIRLDHVMGLFRLFWIPDGTTATAGAYIRYPATELLALLAAESRRARVFVIGEDLGLVEPAVRRRLRARGALSFRLLWFEGPSPGQWPRKALAAIGTHDLPTVAGIWNLSEPDHRQHRLRSRLLSVTDAPDGTSPIDVAVSAYGALARSPSCIVLASLEDALGVEERANVPGTTSEWPNWRLALPQSLEAIEMADGMKRVAEVMRSGRAAPSRRRRHPQRVP